MPSDTDCFVVMFESLYNLNFVKIYRVTYVDRSIVASWRYKAAIYAVAYTANLLGVKLVACETLSHV